MNAQYLASMPMSSSIKQAMDANNQLDRLMYDMGARRSTSVISTNYTHNKTHFRSRGSSKSTIYKIYNYRYVWVSL